jgi:hypothetical protein
MGADTVEPIFATGGENDWRKKKSANHPHPYFIDGAIFLWGTLDRQPRFSADQVKFTCLNSSGVEFLYPRRHHIDHARLDLPSF